MKGINRIVGTACLAAAAGMVAFVTYPKWSETRSPEMLESSGFSAAQFQKMSTGNVAGEYDRPKCGLYSLTLAEPKNFTQYEAFRLTAAARVVAEIGAIRSGGCNCPYDREMPIEAPQALIDTMGAPPATINTKERHRLTKLAEALQSTRLERCGE